MTRAEYILEKIGDKSKGGPMTMKSMGATYREVTGKDTPSRKVSAMGRASYRVKGGKR